MEKLTNWDDVKESSYINEAGRYTLKIMDVKKDVSANGTEFHKYACETKEGSKISVTLYLVEKAMWKYKAFAKACGVSTTGAVNLDELPNALIGRKFVGDVQRQPAKINIVTGLKEESKYFEVAKFYPVEE